MSKPRKFSASPLPLPGEHILSSASAPAGFGMIALFLLTIVIALTWQKTGGGMLLLHLEAGEVIRKNAQIPNRDIFSSGSAVDRWTYFEWGWATILALVYHALKWVGINAVAVGLALISAILMFLRARFHGARPFENIIIITAVMIALLPSFDASPLYAAIPLFILAMRFTENHRLWPMILVVVITAIWANLHSAFFLALLLPFCRLVFPPPNLDTRQTHPPQLYIFLILSGGIIAGFITPYSSDMVDAIASHLTTDAAILAVRPAELYLNATVIVRFVVSLLLLVIICISRYPVHRWEILAMIILGAGILVSPDSLVFLLVYMAAPAARALTQLTGPLWVNHSLRKIAAATFTLGNIALLAMVMSTTRMTPAVFGTGIRPDTFPETAAGRLSTIPLRASVLNPPEHGSYLVWRLWPSWKVVLDNRPDLYSRQFRAEYEKLWEGGQGWESLLNLWRVSAVLGNNDIAARSPGSNLFYRLAESPNWAAVYWDSHSILYIKSNINLATTNLSEYRELKPGLSWAAMEARLESPRQWQDFAADLRRVISDDPLNDIAHEFLRRTEEKLAEQ